MSDDETKQIIEAVVNHWIETHKELHNLMIKDIVYYGNVQPETAIKIAESFDV